jgi:DNA replication protein DnaC
MLRDGTFITKSEPVVFLGNSGTGKSHLLIATCLAAAENGRTVRYITCAQLANELCKAQDEQKLSRLIARYGRLDLLAIDELGYVHLDQKSAELLFQILTEREERASIAIASNAPFSEWTKTFTDKRLAAAVIDRITYKAHIIETGTQSYRLATRG